LKYRNLAINLDFGTTKVFNFENKILKSSKESTPFCIFIIKEPAFVGIEVENKEFVI
jgi:hypothetical protein